VQEYTPAGVLVRTLTPPQNGQARDLVVAPNGDIHLFNGTFSLELSTYHAATGSWSSRTASNWSTVNDLSYGGVGAFGDYVYVTDMQTGNETPPDNGIVRFNLANGAVERFAAGTDYRKFTLGLDGLIYALGPQNGFGNPIDVFDPTTMARLMAVQAPVLDGRGVAVAANGQIYVADWYNTLYRLDPAGAVVNTLSMTDSLTDVDVSTDGKLVVGGRFSVTILNADLTGVQPLAGLVANHVAFADPQIPAPRPVLGNLEGAALSYTEEGAATALTGTLIVTNPNSPTIASATVWISRNFAGAEDVLSFTDQNGITGSYDPAAGVLTLTGAASPAAYWAALRGVRYVNLSHDPSAVPRIVSFQVNDGAVENRLSNTLSRLVWVTPINDAPVLTVPTTGLNGPRGTDLVVAGISVADIDARGGEEKLTLAVSSGTPQFLSLEGVTVVAGANNSASITVRGPLAALKALLAGGNLIYRPNPDFGGADVLSLTIDDTGNTGGGAKIDREWVSITVL
jgi:hypothetical protein